MPPGEPTGMSGSDPSIRIPSVRITQEDGNDAAQRPAGTPAHHSGVIASLGVDKRRLAGTDERNRILMYTPNPNQPGSSVSHYTTDAKPNQLMEPAINADLTHVVTPPRDLTYPLLRISAGKRGRSAIKKARPPRVPGLSPQKQITSALCLVGCDAVDDFRFRFIRAGPAFDLDPLAFFEVLVVLEEVLDLLQAQVLQVFRLLPVAVDRQDLVDRHGQDLGIAAGFVGHLQHADRAATHDHAREQRERGDDQHVAWVAVVRQGLRHIAVVARIVHRGTHEAVDEDRAGVLVHFVLDRIGVHRDFDDDVEVVRHIAAGWDVVQAHGAFLGC
jgi:hypothetical protein